MAQVHRNTDVLVIGGGLGGCWAAIRAKNFAPSVTLVDKAIISRSGASSWANYILAAPPQKDLPIWKKELVEKGDYLNEQDWVDAFLKEHEQRLADMESWGIPFSRDEKGNLIVKKGRGHSLTGFVTSDGKARMESLKKKAEKMGVDIVERVMITDLLTSDGKLPTSGSVIGAIGFNTRTGETLVFESKAVIIATGPIHKGDDNLTGDGIAMAFRAGAELMSMEFCTYPHVWTSDGKRLLGSVSVFFQSLGIKFLNSKGERFMEKYNPLLMERSPCYILTQALAKENLEGRGPVTLDMSQAKEEDIDYYSGLFPTIVRPYKEAGLDLKKDRILVLPAVGISGANGDGGIKLDTVGRTNIPGLYGAGTACKNQLHGTYAVGGLNLAFCCTSGYRAGERAATDSLKVKDLTINQRQVESLGRELFSSMQNKEGPLPETLYSEIEKITGSTRVSIIKKADSIKETLASLKALEEEELPKVRARDYHELVKANQIRNLALISRLIFLSALEREESRSSHYRQDYPYRDDLNWLKWVIIRRGADGEMKLRREPVPFERYQVQPAKRSIIPSPIKFD